MTGWRVWTERGRWAASHHRLVAEALLIALALEPQLRWGRFTTVLNRSGDVEPRADDRHSTVDTLRRAIRFAYAVLPFPRTCLRESLVLRRMCARRGVATVLRIGVQRLPSGLASHAWLEDAAGRVLTEALDHYVALAPLSDAAARS